jgi:hypothetical protein
MDIRMRILALALMLSAFGVPAQAQLNPADRHTRYDIQGINFDLWCQETQKLPPDRCDQRTALDEADYEAYRDKVEKYDVQLEKRKDRQQTFNRNVLHPDPVPNNMPVSNPTDREIASPKPNP